jgi:2-dehydropantoate 2-reductase
MNATDKVTSAAADAAGAPGPVLVMGAGAIGCFLGGCLQAAGSAVTFVGRPRVLDELRRHGLRLTDLDGGDRRLSPDRLVLTESIPTGIRPALVLLCVKSSATADAARTLAGGVPAGSVVVSMQNGASNAEVARLAAPALRVLAGMVPFNVARLAPGHFHRGTSGALAAADDPQLRRWVGAFAAAGLTLELHPDLRAIQWAKLLLNLNNPVNALSGLPLRRQLLDRDFRVCLAALQQEGLAALRAAGIELARLTPLPPGWIPSLLRLPTPLFRLLAARMLRIDADARSSMADDFALGRETEIDALSGEVVRLARSHGSAAPVNGRIVDLIQGWPAHPRTWSGRELRQSLGV